MADNGEDNKATTEIRASQKRTRGFEDVARGGDGAVDPDGIESRFHN